MAGVLLFHHVQGRTPGVEAFADTLRAAGHVVHVPDLFDGLTFDSIDAGVAHVENLGFDAMIDRGVASAAEHRAAMVYAGISMGVLPAQKLAQTRPGSAGAVLLEACAPVTAFGDIWPEGVPVQIHGMEADPFFAGEGDIDAARALIQQVSQPAQAQLFTYPGDSHLFIDKSLASYRPDAAGLVIDRVLTFLGDLE